MVVEDIGASGRCDERGNFHQSTTRRPGKPSKTSQTPRRSWWQHTKEQAGEAAVNGRLLPLVDLAGGRSPPDYDHRASQSVERH